MIRHILLIKFKALERIKAINKLKVDFESMPAKVEGVWGLNDSPKEKNEVSFATLCYRCSLFLNLI